MNRKFCSEIEERKKNVPTAGRHITSDPKVTIAFKSYPKETIAFTSDPKETIAYVRETFEIPEHTLSPWMSCQVGISTISNISSRLTGKVWLLVALLKLEKLSCDKHSSAYKS